MRKSVFQVNKRQKEVLSQLEQDGVVYVTRLSERFGVSEITIRRDLETMERAREDEPEKASRPFDKCRCLTRRAAAILMKRF